MLKSTKHRIVTGLVLASAFTMAYAINDSRKDNTDPTKCVIVYDDADHAIIPNGYGYEGSPEGGIWYTKDGKVFGYSRYEDSIIWNLPHVCEPTYHGK